MPNLYILTGPSGVGKTTVAKRLLEAREDLEKVVTCTTRPPREGEADGRDYHFLTEEQFKEHIDAGEMFEWARVYDRYYGSRKADVQNLLDAGKDVLMVIDVQGAKAIKEERPETVVIFLAAESPEVLMERLERRDEGATANLDERREALEAELAFAKECDYEVVNREGALEETVIEIGRIMDET